MRVFPTVSTTAVLFVILIGASAAAQSSTKAPATSKPKLEMPPPPAGTSQPEPTDTSTLTPLVEEPRAAGQAPPRATASAAPTGPATRRLLVLPKAGGMFPQVLNRLDTSWAAAIELGLLTPVLDNRLAAVVELGFSMPSHTRTVTDSRLPGGDASFTVVERTYSAFLGPKFFILPSDAQITAFAAAGLRGNLVESHLEADSADSDFGKHLERGTHLAYVAQAGGGMRLGPGHAVLELQFVSLPMQHLITGKANLGSLAARAGYLFQF